MARLDRRCRSLDRSAIGDVADFELSVELIRECAKAFLAPSDQYAAVPLSGKRTRGRFADAARRAGDNGDADYLQMRTVRFAASRLPPASRATAVRT